jgi:antitoxin YefM
MYANYQLRADELDFEFFKSIKDTFKGKEIEISVMDYDETEYLLRSPKNKEILLNRIKDVNEGKNMISFTTKEFEKLL